MSVENRPGVQDVEPEVLFETPSLRIRKLTPADFDDLYSVYGDADAMRWVDDGEPIGREACRDWIAVTQRNYRTRGYGMSVMVETSTGCVVGFCGLVHPGGQQTAELKYALKRAYWGRGYATEAATGMLAYGRRVLGLQQIIATIAPENLASQRVLEKAGMQVQDETEDADGTRTRTLVWCA